MSEEKTRIVTTKTGRKMYYLDGKLTTEAKYLTATQATPDFEDVVVKDLEPTPPVAPQAVPSNPPTGEKICIFCGAFGDHTRYVNMRIVYLCKNHYDNEGIGAVVQQLNKT